MTTTTTRRPTKSSRPVRTATGHTKTITDSYRQHKEELAPAIEVSDILYDMLRHTRMPTKRYPGDPARSWPVDDAWRVAIRDQAERKWGRGWQRELAKVVGCTQPAISGLLSLKVGAPNNSELVAAIHDALGIPPPQVATVRASWMADLEREFEGMTEADEEFARNLIALMRAARKQH
jgi:hypothetical protein